MDESFIKNVFSDTSVGNVQIKAIRFEAGTPSSAQAVEGVGEMEPWMDENFIKNVFSDTSAENVFR
ncbi:hypothetical protein QBC40DRAFT_249498 [Triangularia verruculosa]|uniref:Uncharacterized protein n=1 Tax=Triangularia verruculosa TaxID=2587418 RepID=A0AAN7B1P1_9PEZI|nr:hypothetical protein QBC40DRAFT_249498 [Triangularia verruculosa]